MGVTSVCLTDELLNQLQRTAVPRRRSKGWVVSEASIEFMANEERAMTRLERTRKALEQVETGRLVDGDEVKAWIASWGTDKETTPPK